MKYLYASILWLASYTFAVSQVPNCTIPKPINEEIADIISPIDKSQIPTGILYESVFPWAEITSFDGSETTDTTSTLHFIQAYSEIYNSSFSRGSMIHPSDFEKKLIDFHSDPDFHHPIGIIDYNFNTIKDDAVTNNLLSVNNGKLYDVIGRTDTPYESKNTFIAVPLFAEGFDRLFTGATHTFYLDSDFILSNNGFTLSDYEFIDFEVDGQLIHRETISSLMNNPQHRIKSPKGPIFFFAVLFPFIQVTKFAVLTITLKNKIFGKKINRIELKKEDLKSLTNCDGLNQIFVTGDSFDAGYGQGAYSAKGRGYIFFAENNCNSQQIRKPVIFVDGFDPTNSRKVWDIYDGRVNRRFTENGVEKRFGDELRSNGKDYDIIVYDYDEKGVNRGGAGFIENNGRAFAKFLETLYNQHQSTIQQDFVIVAPSMGAMVVRYALAYMDKNNIPHHTRTYISFDGPQQGAQVPHGVQQMIDMVTQYGGLRIFEGVRNFLHQNNAAKQMLVSHSSTGSEEIEPHPFRNTFLNNLNLVNQYPSNCRMVAIVNGNRSGLKKSTPQPDNETLSPCEQEFELAIIKTKDPVCTSNCDVVRIKAYTQTENARCESLNFKVDNKTSLFKKVFGGGTFIQKSFYTLPFNNQSYDIAPGGNFGADAEVEGDQIKGLNKILQKLTKKNLGIPLNKLPFTNFMPTISSVDYTFPNNENYNLYRDFSSINLSKCAGTTPFDTVYAPLDKDLGHARNDERLINAFRNEIYNLPNSICAGNCQDYVTLNSTIPDNSTDIYRAGKAIKLEPNFFANGNSNVVFTAIIGCPQLQLYQPKPKVKSPNQISKICSLQPFEFDQAKNYKTCNGGNTTFHVFVHNIDINTYAEFSTDVNATVWYKANILDNGYEITLPNNTDPQIFFARSADNRGNVIGGYLGFCN